MEPEPQITITCHKMPVPGMPGHFQLVPQLTFTQMPGGWATVLEVLLQCVKLVAHELVKEAAYVPQLTPVAQVLPDGSSLLRH